MLKRIITILWLTQTVTSNAMSGLASYQFGYNLRRATTTQDETQVLALLTDNSFKAPDPYQDSGGASPLHIASTHGNLNIMIDLITYGMPLNTQDDDGDTALHNAIYYRKAQAIALLLYYGANPNIKDDRGNTPLHAATNNGNMLATRLLLLFGADKTILNQRNELPNQNIISQTESETAQIEATSILDTTLEIQNTHTNIQYQQAMRNVSLATLLSDDFQLPLELEKLIADFTEGIRLHP